eukprot:TRINITY_DN40990_c0_g1_i2.p1 TRINITY_DN40990_c0_g1~~TRINITY_DN40990_c0_g1_i2.p1  ORF type:complete len:516 (-),score=92.50 TRINITY_DN40990_c0_g1_i2:63-1610(-)
MMQEVPSRSNTVRSGSRNGSQASSSWQTGTRMSLRRSVASGRNSYLSKGTSGLLVSSFRFDELHTSASAHRLMVCPEQPPPFWPAPMLSFLHNVSMGAALAVWVDVCKMAYAEEELKRTPSLAQTMYGRLLAVNAICELVTSQMVGTLSDAFGRRPLEISAQTGQLIDYMTAALCLPTLGLLGQVDREYIFPLLCLTRGIAGLMGNFRITLQSYASDISDAADCPDRLAIVGAAMVIGMCVGSGLVPVLQALAGSYRICFYAALVCNVLNIVLVLTCWRDVAPKSTTPLRARDMNPLQSMYLIGLSPTMSIYMLLIFLSSFSLNMLTSTLTYYCEEFLKMDKSGYVMLGGEWALLSALAMAYLQPFLTGAVGEVRTLQISFFAMSSFYLAFSMVTAENVWVAFIFMASLSVSTISYPLAVGLATREVNPEEQGLLQGAISVLETTGKITAPILASDVLIPMYEKDGQFHGMVYLVAGIIVMPGIFLSFRLGSLTRRTLEGTPRSSRSEVAEIEVS